MGMSTTFKRRMAAGEAFARVSKMHAEPDADERGGPSDGDADNAKMRKGRSMLAKMSAVSQYGDDPAVSSQRRAPARKTALRRPGMPSGQRAILD